MSGENIFSALAKCSPSEDENYLTEAFVFLINSLLAREHSVASDILSKLCTDNNEFSFNTDENISVSAQEIIEQGILDIKISSSDKEIYVEVKDYSPVNVGQLKRYRKHLESSSVPIKRLILLTRFPVDPTEHQEIPDKYVCWFEIYNWLSSAEDKTRDPVSTYLIQSFKSFLEVKRMSIEKVGWEYINGVPAFNNLINMIEAAIKDAGISFYMKHPKAAAWDSKGFWLENRRYYCGIYYNAPLTVIFKSLNKKDLNAGNVKAPSYPIKEAWASMWFMLQLESIHFFSLDKDKQLEEITKFISTAYKEAQQMRIKEPGH